MLFDSGPLDFRAQRIVFVHIPKTGGSSLRKVLFNQLGAENCIELRSEKLEKIHTSGIHQLAWTAREAVRRRAMRLVGADPRNPKDNRRAGLEAMRAVSGHFGLGQEPASTRQPAYITLVRDPVDRFLSHYYFIRDMSPHGAEAGRAKHPAQQHDLEEFVQLLHSGKLKSVTNVQCRYLGGSERFDCARRAVDERVFLAAPSKRSQDFLDLLRPVLCIQAIEIPQENVGRAKLKAPAPSHEILDKIRSLVSQDQLLFDYVSDQFNALYR